MLNKYQQDMIESPIAKFKKEVKGERRRSSYQNRVEEFKQKVSMSEIIPFKILKM